MSRTIPVSDETHNQVDVLRASRKDKKFDDTVIYLLSRPDLTEGEVESIITVMVCGSLEGFEAKTKENLKSAEHKLRKCLAYYFEKGRVD